MTKNKLPLGPSPGFTFTRERIIAALAREIALRQAVYAGRVRHDAMSLAKAHEEVAAMRAALIVVENAMQPQEFVEVPATNEDDHGQPKAHAREPDLPDDPFAP